MVEKILILKPYLSRVLHWNQSLEKNGNVRLLKKKGGQQDENYFTIRIYNNYNLSPKSSRELAKVNHIFCGFSRTVLKFRQLYEVWKQEAKNWEKRRVEHLNVVTASIFTTFNLN